MKKYLVLTILSALFLTGCTEMGDKAEKELQYGECQKINVSDISFSTDVIKIKCKNIIYRCFRFAPGYGGGIDCLEVQE